jgi:hypothetical protein
MNNQFINVCRSGWHYVKTTAKVAAVAMLGVFGLGLAGTTSVAAAQSAYVAPLTSQFTTIQSDLVSAIPVTATVMLVLVGAGLIMKLFKRLAK